jgi:hypothetical protein
MAAEQDFWNWFVGHEPELFEFEGDSEAERERIFDELAMELHKVDPDLAFEFGPKDATREFVVSAGGIRRAFSAVVSLVTSAPPLDRWEIIAFRPRRPPCVVNLGGKQVDPGEVQFSLLDNGKIAGICLFIPGFRQDEIELKQIGYLLLDSALGEYDVETRLGLIEMHSPQTAMDGERYPLNDLPALFDELVSRLEKRTGKSS